MSMRLKIDFEKAPPMFKVSETHYAATWLLHPDAPQVEPPQQYKRMKIIQVVVYEGQMKEGK